MLEKSFETLYLMFRANYFRQMLEVIGGREGSLSATDGYCVEIIFLLGRPTITEFAQYLGLSLPNAHYKINNLVKKGYVVRQQSTTDLREQYLCVTDKFLRYYGLNDSVTALLMQRIRQTFPPQDVERLDEMIGRVIALMQMPGDEIVPALDSNREEGQPT